MVCGCSFDMSSGMAGSSWKCQWDRVLEASSTARRPVLRIASRVARAHAAGRIEPGSGGAVLIRDLQRRDVVYVCRPDAGELVVVTLWEEGEAAAVPKRFTDALRRDDHRVS